MKGNLKGLGGIKGLLLMHGEKAGIALVGLLALWFVYSSLGLEGLDSRYQATSLQSEISQANNTVQNAEWPPPDSELAPNVRYAREVAKNADPVVDSGPYAIDGGGFMPVIPPTQRRSDPPMLGAVDVEAIGGSGLFAFVDAEILKQQALKQEALADERQREAEKQAEQQRQQAEQGRGRGGPEGRGEMGAAFDPAHPDRRAIQGMTRPAGAPLQGGERIERAYWATFVAKVPVREQRKLYQDAFQNARGYDPANDFPQYVGYIVERSEVERGKPLEWQRVPVYDAQRKSILANKPVNAKGVDTSVMNKLYELAQEFWAGGGPAPEPVAEHFLGDPVLTFPLPPLVGRDWGADVTHPDIPLAINAPPLEEEIEPLAEAPTDPAEGAALFQSRPDEQQMLRQPAGRFGGGRLRGGRGFGGEGRLPFAGREMMGGPREGGFGGGRGGPGQRTSLPRGVDFWLLRFMDFTVEPGKKYKYRVKLALADPNQGMPDRTLEPAVQDRLRAANRSSVRLVEEWSDPSPTVGIPLAGTVYVAETTPANEKKFNDEPVVKLMVETFDVDADGTAVHIAKEKEFRRGYVVNMHEKMEYTGDGDRWIDTFDKYRIQTGATLLDVAGGDRLTRDMSAPARVLLMDPSGELSIRGELDDSTSVEYLRLLFAEPDKRRGGEGEMMFGPGMAPFRGGRER